MNLGFRKLLHSRAKPTALARPLPDIYSLASDETCRGGYLITEDPEAPVMILTVPLPLNNKFGDAAHLSVSVPPEMLEAGQFYLIGDPMEQSCEVVRVEGEAVPGQPRCHRVAARTGRHECGLFAVRRHRRDDPAPVRGLPG